MPEPWTLFFSFLFGTFGVGYFLYGKKQSKLVPLICGIVLMIFPYFVSNRFAIVGIGIGIMLVAYFVRT